MHWIINIRKISLFFIVVFSGFYLTRVLSLSPVYILCVLGSVLVLLNVIFREDIRVSSYSVVFTLYIFYLLVTQVLLDAEISPFINVVFSLFYFFIVLNIANYSNKKTLVKLSKYFIYFTILLLTIEAIWRLSHPVFVLEGTNKDYRDTEGMFFYAYKYSSIMFKDSNFVGTYALVSFFYYYFLLRNKFVKNKLPLCMLGVLILGTISRSAIITMFLGILILPLFTKKNAVLYMFLLAISLIVGSILIIPTIETDLSFLSKFKILELTGVYLQKASIGSLLFGIGFGNTVNYIGIGAHNLFVTHIIESGVIGFLFFIIANFVFIKPTRKCSLYLTLPLFISGMSLAGHALTYYYSCLALIYVLTKDERKSIRIDSYI